MSCVTVRLQIECQSSADNINIGPIKGKLNFYRYLSKKELSHAFRNLPERSEGTR